MWSKEYERAIQTLPLFYCRSNGMPSSISVNINLFEKEENYEVHISQKVSNNTNNPFFISLILIGKVK